MIRGDARQFDVDFDVWQSERELHEPGEVKATLNSSTRRDSSIGATTRFGCVPLRYGGTTRIAWW